MSLLVSETMNIKEFFVIIEGVDMITLYNIILLCAVLLIIYKYHEEGNDVFREI